MGTDVVLPPPRDCVCSSIGESMKEKTIIVRNVSAKKWGFPPQDLEFGKRLKKILKNRHITQAKLCELTGFSRTMMYKWTNGQAIMRVHTFAILVDALNLTISDISYLFEPFWEDDEE